MILLHPQVLSKEGEPQFTVLPYEEYLQLVTEAAKADVEALKDARFGGFYDNLSAEEHARRQGVGPIENLEDLEWPYGPEDWDGFDEAVDEWRHPNTVAPNLQ